MPKKTDCLFRKEHPKVLVLAGSTFLDTLFATVIVGASSKYPIYYGAVGVRRKEHWRSLPRGTLL